ncbi:hypothetical protein SAY87_003039 [Trapa incisa]|uniref:Uncharacterized protein n=1 Tax=Trapa incisa TaxID=236973 RepID=A0AAN7QIH8_9MYRT|nr:hypothetical protein SAY87_003039 [Trapa incisa]
MANEGRASKLTPRHVLKTEEFVDRAISDSIGRWDASSGDCRSVNQVSGLPLILRASTNLSASCSCCKHLEETKAQPWQ